MVRFSTSAYSEINGGLVVSSGDDGCGVVSFIEVKAGSPSVIGYVKEGSEDFASAGGYDEGDILFSGGSFEADHAFGHGLVRSWQGDGGSAGGAVSTDYEVSTDGLVIPPCFYSVEALLHVEGGVPLASRGSE